MPVSRASLLLLSLAVCAAASLPAQLASILIAVLAALPRRERTSATISS